MLSGPPQWRAPQYRLFWDRPPLRPPHGAQAGYRWGLRRATAVGGTPLPPKPSRTPTWWGGTGHDGVLLTPTPLPTQGVSFHRLMSRPVPSRPLLAPAPTLSRLVRVRQLLSRRRVMTSETALKGPTPHYKQDVHLLSLLSLPHRNPAPPRWAVFSSRCARMPELSRFNVSPPKAEEDGRCCCGNRAVCVISARRKPAAAEAEDGGGEAERPLLVGGLCWGFGPGVGQRGRDGGKRWGSGYGWGQGEGRGRPRSLPPPFSSWFSFSL